MPQKQFIPGQPLAAADLNTYFMNQVIITCTSATRPAFPVQGQVIYQIDTDTFYYYDGTQWIQLWPPKSVYTGTPVAQSLTSSGTLGVNGVTGLPTLAYATLITASWGCLIGTATAGDQTQVGLRVAGVDVQYQQGNAVVWSGGGVHSFPVAAGATPPVIQTVFTALTGTGSKATYADGRVNWLEVVVARA